MSRLTPYGLPYLYFGEFQLALEKKKYVSLCAMYYVCSVVFHWCVIMIRQCLTVFQLYSK